MATVTGVRVITARDGPVALFKWPALTATNADGSALLVGARPGKSVHLVGTFGGAVTIRGSNLPTPDPTAAGDWAVLTDPQGIALSFTAEGIKEILENVLWISPHAAAGVTSVDVYLLATSSQRIA